PLDLPSFPTRRSSDLIHCRGGAPAQLRYEPHRLERDTGRHLARTRLAVLKHDWELAHREPRDQGPVRDLDLEHVAIGADGVEVRSEEHTSELQSPCNL